MYYSKLDTFKHQVKMSLEHDKMFEAIRAGQEITRKYDKVLETCHQLVSKKLVFPIRSDVGIANILLHGNNWTFARLLQGNTEILAEISHYGDVCVFEITRDQFLTIGINGLPLVLEIEGTANVSYEIVSYTISRKDVSYGGKDGCGNDKVACQNDFWVFNVTGMCSLVIQKIVIKSDCALNRADLEVNVYQEFPLTRASSEDDKIWELNFGDYPINLSKVGTLNLKVKCDCKDWTPNIVLTWFCWNVFKYPLLHLTSRWNNNCMHNFFIVVKKETKESNVT